MNTRLTPMSWKTAAVYSVVGWYLRFDWIQAMPLFTPLILGKILLHMKPLALLLQVVLLFCFQTKTSPNKQHFSQINNLSFFSRSVTNWSCSRFMVRRGVYFGSVSGPALSIRYLMEPRLWQDRIDSPFRHCSSFHLNRLQISEYRLIMLYKK